MIVVFVAGRGDVKSEALPLAFAGMFPLSRSVQPVRRLSTTVGTLLASATHDTVVGTVRGDLPSVLLARERGPERRTEERGLRSREDHKHHSISIKGKRERISEPRNAQLCHVRAHRIRNKHDKLLSVIALLCTQSAPQSRSQLKYRVPAPRRTSTNAVTHGSLEDTRARNLYD